MKIKSISIKNFRSYMNETTISFDNLTAFIGKNDVGKSTILEALDVFFHDGKGSIKLDKEDRNKNAIDSGDTDIVITASFKELPTSVILDETNSTTLQDEYLLNSDGCLQVKKTFKGGSTTSSNIKVSLLANHPTNSECDKLLQKKQADLLKIIEKLGIECEDKRKNALMRKAIWNHFHDDLQLSDTEIDVSSKDGDIKSIWEKLQNSLPFYSLFQADRKNCDGDDEVQDPLKAAVKQILNDGELQRKLHDVAISVQETLQHVSDLTLAKLREMNPEIANSLHPNINFDNLKWSDVFKNVSISGDNDIPINKRGSGVKRLILINFFRAEAERKRSETTSSGIIYAIEEPETSQHKEHQRLLMEALHDLSQQNNTQVIITTHSSDIVKCLKFGNIRLICNNAIDGKDVKMVAQRILPSPSLNEVNYLAFGDISEEYHNELYGYLQAKAVDENPENEKEAGFERWLQSKGCLTSKSWIRIFRGVAKPAQPITLQTYIRNYFHHPENDENARYTYDELKQSIEKMVEIAETI